MHKASKAKNDEFYTRLEDIENELRHYRSHFKDKIVLCNCDDPFESNFFKYFALNFNYLGLKKLICTSYAGSPISHTEFNDLPLFQNNQKMPYMIEISEVRDYNNDGAEDITDIECLLRNNKNTLTILDGDGDFRSEECIEFLKEADVVVTNPPFSIAREYYVPQLMKYDKKFLIIGDLNWVTYRKIFPLLKDNKMWFGYNNVKEFVQPNNEIKKFGNKLWYTNLDTAKRHDELILYKQYNDADYPKYENCDAINVDNVANIPENYYGIMGVPITFLDKYNPDQFDVIGLGISNSGLEVGVKPYKKEHKEYRKNVQHRGAVDGDLYYLDKDGHPCVPYARILIKRRKNEN